jgi:hypothetical protein
MVASFLMIFLNLPKRAVLLLQQAACFSHLRFIYNVMLRNLLGLRELVQQNSWESLQNCSFIHSLVVCILITIKPNLTMLDLGAFHGLREGSVGIY